MTIRSQARTQAALPLATRCYAEFGGDQRFKGTQLFQRGHVVIEAVTDEFVDACVRDGRDELNVSLDWLPTEKCREMAAECDCPEFAKRETCAHVWAVMLEMDQAGITQRIPGTSPIFVHAQDDLDEDGLGDGMEPGARTRKPRPEKTADWTRQLQQVREASEAFVARDQTTVRPGAKPREIHFLISPEKSLERGGLVVLFFQRQPRKDGNLGKAKPLRLDSNVLESVTDAAEHRVLELLVECPAYEHYGLGYYSGYSSYGGGRTGVTVPPALWDVLLPQLAATGRLGYSRSKMDDPENVQPLEWDAGPPWKFELQVSRAADRAAWRIEGRLEREGEQMALGDPVFLLREGLVVLTSKVARLDARESFGWIVGLRRSGAIFVPFSDQDKLVEQLWEIPALPPTNLDAELRWEQVVVVPQPRLRITQASNKYQKNLSAVVTFDYDGFSVGLNSMQSGLVDRDRSRVILRDRSLEQDWVKKLTSWGFRPPPYYQRDHDLELPATKLPAATRELVRAGWLVEAEGKLVRRPGEVRLSVSSSVDWFDLDGQVDYGGISIGLPKLLEAVRRGEQFVTLGDGTQGMLPEEWLKKFGMLADLGSVEEGKLRFVPSQAAILDALLAAQPEMEIDERFEEVRQRLRTFSGVQPAQPPAGFQGTLRDYQTLGLGWLHFLRDFQFGGCLADDMGLGKTVQVLALLEARRQRDVGKDQPRRLSLAVVPRSLVFNWIEEARRFTPGLRVLNYTGLERKEALTRLDDYDLLITTYGTLRRDVLQFQELHFDYAILDEAQAIKNASSQAAKACRLIRADYRLAMSGTPIENHLGELWSLFEFLNPGMLGRSSTLKLLSSGTDEGNRSLLAKALKPFILRRTKEQVLKELPEKTEQTLYCELEDQQRKLYDELRDHYRASLDKRIQEGGLKKAKIHVLEALLRLRQAACHPGLLDKKRINEPSAKLETLLEQLEEVLAEGHKALVFSQFTSLLAIVRQRLDEQKINYEYLDGRTRNRQERVEHFQADVECRLFLISLKAGGQGLNLTAADYVFILDPWWNPAVEAQAVDRAHRIGQQQRVFAYRLIARDTVEEKILKLQANKRNLADAIISEDNSVISSLTVDDLQLLLS